MNEKQVWCNVCNKMVEAGIEEGAATVLPPVLGGTAGGLIGKAKGHWGHAILGTLIGVGVGAIVQAFIPKAQRMVCGECGGYAA